jgi:hypothetical protein
MSKESDNNVSILPEKLLIDDPSNFQFHVAYLTYSAIYDSTANIETKRHLNQNIKDLQQNHIDCATFYKNISQYRAEDTRHDYGRALIKTQRKREWRRKTQRHERIERHKK